MFVPRERSPNEQLLRDRLIHRDSMPLFPVARIYILYNANSDPNVKWYKALHCIDDKRSYRGMCIRRFLNLKQNLKNYDVLDQFMYDQFM